MTAPAAGVLVSVDLPPGTVEVPVPADPSLDAAAADHVLAALAPAASGQARRCSTRSRWSS